MEPQEFQHYLGKYAQLIVEFGINVQPGQTVVLQARVNQYPLARLIVKEAYAKGASEVVVNWEDDFIQKETLLHADEKVIGEVPEDVMLQGKRLLAKGASHINLVSSAPDAYAGVPQERLALFQQATNKKLAGFRNAAQANKVCWNLSGAASPEWAAKVFPELPAAEQVPALWDEIFKTTRIYTPDSIAAWRHHRDILVAKAQELNAEQFNALHFTAEGTDLVVGLPKNHFWDAASSTSVSGVNFMANMPTEEVFTAPDAQRVDGIVKSTKPLSYLGTIIEGITLTFKDGAVVAGHAEKGDEVLQSLLQVDEGSRRLGEVALVPDESPISQSNITFYTTLFDENASNHLALGAAYAFNLQGGEKMKEEELIAAGLNRSQVHVDFMIGSPNTNIDGVRADGTRVPLFRNGNWAVTE